MSQAPRQSISYQIARSGQLSANELAVLHIISTYSEYCCPRRVADIGVMIKKSERTVRRALYGLIAKGLVKRTYTVFKRLVLRIVSHDIQRGLFGQNLVEKIVGKSVKRHKYSYDRSKTTEVVRSTVAEPIKSKTEREKHIGIELKKPKNKAEQMREYYLMYPHLLKA